MKDNCNLEWEEIFANEDTDKEFISKTHKEPQIVQYQNHNNPRHKWAKHRNRCFLEEVIQTVIRHLRTFSASLILTQTQSKSNKVLPHTGHNGHLKICPKVNARDGVERRELSCTVVFNRYFLIIYWICINVYILIQNSQFSHLYLEIRASCRGQEALQEHHGAPCLPHPPRTLSPTTIQPWGTQACPVSRDVIPVKVTMG